MKQPEIRFNEFSEEWVEKRLGELLKERKVTQQQSNDAPLVSFTVEKGVTPKTDRYDREGLVTGDKDAKRYKLTLLDDIVYNPANLKFGAISRNKFGKAVFSPIYVTYFQKDGNSDMRFMEMIVTSDSFIKHVRKYEQGTVYERQSVSSSDMLKAVIQLPTLPEQQKIGALFSKYDAIIALREQKLAELNALKKGMLQQMFDDGVAISHKPQVRFSGFNDEWDIVKLKDVVTESIEKSATEDQYDVLSSTVNGIELRKGRVSGRSNIGYKVLDLNHLVLSPQNLWLGNINVNRFIKGIVSPSYKVYAFNSDLLLSTYASYMLRTARLLNEYKDVSVQGASTVRRSLDLNRFYDIKCELPSLPEQQKIGELFKKLDAEIAAEETKIDWLKKQKQGLLKKAL